jgi:hypothetical protein
VRKTSRRIALGRETLRHLDPTQLERAAGELTGTATFTCQDNSCSCLTCFATCVCP